MRLTIIGNLPDAGPFENLLVQVGYGGFTDDFPMPGESYDIDIFDGMNNLLVSTAVNLGNNTSNDFSLGNNISINSVRLEISNIVGEFEIHQGFFYEKFANNVFKRSLLIVRDPDPNFVVTALTPVPLPAGAPLLLGGLAILGLIRRRRNLAV